jgi:hypothetical protein
MRIYGILIILVLLAGCANSGSARTPHIDRISAEELDKLIPQPVPNLPLDEIVRLSQQGVTADDIIAKIRQSQSRYRLVPSQMIELSGQGVSPKVLDYIQSAQEQALRDGLTDEINRREKVYRDNLVRLERQWALWPAPGFGAYWGGPYWGPYWGGTYPYGYRNWRRPPY